MNGCYRFGLIMLASTGLAAPTAAQAPAQQQGAWLGFRNDLNVPIVIQMGVLDKKNQVRPLGRPHVLYPREVSLDPIIPAGNRVITISTAKRPAQVLFQDTIAVKEDLFYSVQPDPPGKGKLVPAKMPTPPRRMR